MVKPFRTKDINGLKCRTPEQVQEASEHGRTAVTQPRYQLWMRLVFHHPGYHPTEGRAQFAWTIIDTQQPDHESRRLRAQEYGFVLAGGSDVQGEQIETMLQYGVLKGENDGE